ncbi:MAG: hypothetical protein LN573_03900 [Rickettsia endosymbiont of Oxypoda opaca]|nr:hypothetical protein [Rickettsia endosymbiont of Oxypoda opaca]
MYQYCKDKEGYVMADEKDDAQLKNAISAIKVQLTATANPAELARLGSEAVDMG